MVRLIVAAAALGLMSCGAARADFITHEDANSFFGSYPGYGADAPAEILSVTSAQSITSFGVYMTLAATENVKFQIWNHDTGVLLFESAPQTFSDGTTANYKMSAEFSPFTFVTGTNYALDAIADGPVSTKFDYTANTVAGFNFQTGNDYVANYANTHLLGQKNCCDLWTKLETATAVPEPASLAIVGIGLTALVPIVRSRRR